MAYLNERKEPDPFFVYRTVVEGHAIDRDPEEEKCSHRYFHRNCLI